MIARIYLSNISGNNNMDTDLVLGPDNLIDPHVIITAELEQTTDNHFSPDSTNNGVDSKPMILTHRYLLQRAILHPGQSNSVTETLNLSPLRQILQDHPQQNYEITFRVYLDPVSDGNGSFVGKIPAIQPVPITVTRKAFIPTAPRMDAVYETARFGTPKERIKTIRLIAGLLREADLARQGRLSYQPQAIKTDILQKIITDNLNHTDAQVSGWSVYALRGLTITAQSEQAQKLAELLSDAGDANWFVRFMAVETLYPTTDLTEYFQWAEVLEKNPLLRRQMQFLQGQPWSSFNPSRYPPD